MIKFSTNIGNHIIIQCFIRKLHRETRLFGIYDGMQFAPLGWFVAGPVIYIHTSMHICVYVSIPVIMVFMAKKILTLSQANISVLFTALLIAELNS